MQKQDLIDFVNEEKLAWEQGLIKAPVHLCSGNEDQLIEIFKDIKPHDYILSSHRNTYHALLAGVSCNKLMDEILGKPSGDCLGRARSMGFIDVKHNFYSSAIVGGMCGIAVGIAWAIKEQEKQVQIDPCSTDEYTVLPPKKHVWCFVGDGVVDGGHFWESLQYAHGWDLPITFIIEDNDRATCTDVKSRLGTKESLDGAWRTMLASKHVIHYEYKPTYPHVGTGKYVAF